MRDVIQRVIATEAEAKEIVAAARVEAQRIVSGARHQAEAVLDGAREEARQEAEQLLTAALRQAGQEKQERMARVRCEIEQEIRLDPEPRRRLVTEVIRVVCGLPRRSEEPP